MRSCIGEGGYGKVYRSRDAPGVVCKESRLWDDNTKSKDGELNSVNLREAVLMSSINHPGVIRATGVTYTKRHLSMLMEYGGISLADWIDKYGTCRRHLIRGLFRQLVNIVYDLWCMGIQQVDMVPENIVVDDGDGDGNADADADAEPRLRIIDLGLCSMRVHIGEWTDGFGSWIYCPPEVVLMDCVGDATPVWNLAMIAAFMWTRSTPLEFELEEGEKASSRKVISHILRHNRDTNWSRYVIKRGMSPEWSKMFDRMTEWREGRRMTIEEVHAIINATTPHVSPWSASRLGIPVVMTPFGESDAPAPGPLKAIMEECNLSRPQRRMLPYAQWLWSRISELAVCPSLPLSLGAPEKEVAVACLAWGQVLVDSLEDRIVRGWCEATHVSEVVVAQTMLNIADLMHWRMIQC